MKILPSISAATALFVGAVCACGSSGKSAPTDATHDSIIEIKTAPAIDTVTSPAVANLHNPLPTLPKPLMLSGNFGELRNNHFHSGVDFKTGGRTGAKVVAADSGYVSRALVSPWGFGRAVYVTHTRTGLTTVYGHLESFANKIDAPVRAEQYNRETFSIDMEFAPGEIPVARGEQIGVSGNAGSSGGPHLHFDVRHTASGDALDPLPYYSNLVVDKVVPQPRALDLYAVEGEGYASRVPAAKGAVSKTFKAWGKVYPAIKAYDRMTDTHNIYGVKHLSLEVDGHEIYRRTIDRFSFDDTRAVHTLIDYPTLRRSGSWMMTTKVPQLDPLYYMIDAENHGIINIDSERDYKCSFIMEDAYGNRSRENFTIRGERRAISPREVKGKIARHNHDFRFIGKDIEIFVPAGTLYEDLDFTHSVSRSEKYVSPVHHICSNLVPLHKAITISIDIPSDKIADTDKYVLVRVGGGKGGDVAVDAKYIDGKMVAKVTNLGNYAVTTDTKAPTIRKAKKDLAYIISDNLSGIAEYRGEIDGKFALFEYDAKNALLSFKPDGKYVRRDGKQHNVVIYLRDRAGNQAEFTDRVTL